MRRRVWFGLMPVACALACFLASAGCKGNKDGKGTGTGAGTGQASAVSVKVCPRVLYANFTTYRAWYAQRCDTHEFVNLNTTKDREGKCDGDLTLCEDADKRKGTGTKGFEEYHFQPSLRAGIAKAPKIASPIQTSATIRLLQDTHTKLKTTSAGHEVNVALYLVEITSGGAVKKYGVGIEVTDAPQGAMPPIDYSQIAQVHGKICNLQHPPGMQEYQVILDAGTPVESRKK